MIAISTRELIQSGDKYFDLAMTQPVFLRRRKVLYRLQVADSNPSPSSDPFYANPLNVEKVVAAVSASEQDVKAGKVKTFATAESAINYFDSL